MIFFNLAIRDNKPFTWSGNPCLLKAPPRPISAQEAGVIRGPETGLQVFGSPSWVHGTFDRDSTVLYCRPKRCEITCFSHTVQNITIIQGSHYFILAHFRSYCILYVYPYIDSFRRNIGFLINISYVLINSNFTCLSHFEKNSSLTTILCHNKDLSFVIELCVCPLFCCIVNWNLFNCFFFMCIVNV